MCLLRIDRLAEAESLLLAAVEHLPAQGISLAPHRTALNALAELYDHLGKTEQADAVRARLRSLPDH